jgi:hypothetical protein
MLPCPIRSQGTGSRSPLLLQSRFSHVVVDSKSFCLSLLLMIFEMNEVADGLF